MKTRDKKHPQSICRSAPQHSCISGAALLCHTTHEATKVSYAGETHPQCQPTPPCTGMCHCSAQALLALHSRAMGPHVLPAGPQLSCVPKPRRQERSRAPGGDRTYVPSCLKQAHILNCFRNKTHLNNFVTNPPLTWLLNCSKFSELLIHQKVSQVNGSTSNAYINHSYSIIILKTRKKGKVKVKYFSQYFNFQMT